MRSVPPKKTSLGGLACDVTFVNSTVTKLYDATWYLTMISHL